MRIPPAGSRPPPSNVVDSKPAEAAKAPVKATKAAPVAEKALTPEQVVTQYYAAMNARDFGALEKLYAPNAMFRDNVFRFDNREGIIGMWKKLPKDATVKHELLRVDGGDATTKISWDYTLFGKKVHNEEEAHLTIRDGRITAQREKFDFGKWGHQAFPFLPEKLLDFAEPVVAPLLRMFA
jgi:ketosteroid isomerase-like protein